MELNKQQKLINRKFAYNTGKLPGFQNGFAAEKQSGYPTDSPEYKEHLSPYQMMKDHLGGKSFIGSHFDKTVQNGSGYVSNDPYRTNPNLKAPGSVEEDGGPISDKINNANIQTAASALPGFIGNMIGSWTNYESKDEILAKYHPMQASVGGIGFNKLTKNKNGKLPGYSFGNVAGATASGASMGSVAGPWGAVIGGAVGLVGSTIGEIISGDKQRRHEEEVAEWVKGYNNGERGGAISRGMQLYNQKTHGDQYSQSLIPHANGKLPGFENGLESAIGKVSGEATAMVSNGEVMSEDGYMHRVGKGKDSNDTRRAIAGPRTTIFPNKGASIFGEDISDFVWRTGDVNTGTEMLRALNAMKGRASYKNGKLPRCAEGWLGNGIPAIFGSIAGLGQYLDAKNSRLYYPRTYVANPYEGEALNTLAGLRINPYPIARQLRDAEARSNRAVDMAGGLSGSQRTAARLANLNTTQGNISNLLSSIQQQNNAYRANYAQAAINAGQQARTARMAANQWDLDYYSKAHAARNKGMQTGIANMLAQSQQYIANEFKRNQFNRTMSLYEADQNLRNDQLNWYKDNAAKLANIGSMFNMPSLYRSKPLYYKDENGNYIEIPA